MRVGIPSRDSYILTNERLIVNVGFIERREEELELSRVKEIEVTQKPFEKNLGMGDVAVYSTDTKANSLRLENVENPLHVKEIITSAVKQARLRLGASSQQETSTGLTSRPH